MYLPDPLPEVLCVHSLMSCDLCGFGFFVDRCGPFSLVRPQLLAMIWLERGKLLG
jgi:hypothetical protein